MPRKKLDSSETAPLTPVAKPTPKKKTVTAPVPEAATPKPRPSRAEVKPVAQPQPESAPATPSPKPRPSRAKVKPDAEPIAVEPVAVEIAPVVEPEPQPAKPTPKPRPSRAKAKPTVEAEPQPAKAAPRPRPSRAKVKPPVEPQPEPVEAALWEDGDLPVPIWRPVQGKPRPKTAVPDEDDFEAIAGTDTVSEDRADPDRRKRRRRRGRSRSEETEPVAAESAGSVEAPVAEPEPPAEPAVRPSFRSRRPEPAPVAAPVVAPPKPEFRAPRRPPIESPADAPQVVLRDGLPTLVRRGRVYPPLFFFGSPSDERRANTVLEELATAADAGVHLHAFLVDLEVDRGSVDAAVAVAAFLLAKAVAADPEAQVLFRLAFVAPRNWPDRYPDARWRNTAGEVTEPSICDDQYWGVAAECLATFVKKLRLLDLKDHVLGIHLERGEWFMGHGDGYDMSPAARQGFRDWARTRYSEDEVTLRASWFDGGARFDNILVPEYRPEGSEGERFVRSSRKQRRYVDYHLFLSDATVGRISDLAYTVKEASQGWFLVGASYGYTFEWSHPASGHLSLGKLLRAPEIDFIAGPPSYRNREPGGTAAFPCPIDSFALNGKLYLSEEDFKTTLSGGHEPDDFNPPMRTPQALDAVHWRGIGASLAHGSGAKWMDLWGNGWLKSHSIWERASAVLDALTLRMGVPVGNPDVAVFIDERALAYLVDENAFTLLVQNVRESVLRAGVSAAFYLLSDLQHRERFPESKLYLFLNAWDIRPELRAAIKTRLQRDRKVLFWLYSAGLFDAGRDSLERAREVTGIALKPQPFHSKSGTTILNRRHPLAEAFPERSLVGGTKLEPSYFAIPEDATVLGEYTQTGLPSFVVKEFRDGAEADHWTSVFLGEPVVNPALIRALAQMAGAPVYNFHNDVTHVRAPFLTVHCSGAGPRTITLPAKFSAYNLTMRQWSAVDTTNLRFNAQDGMTYVFLVGPKEEIEQMLNADPAAVLRMDRLPAREANVLGDISSFDVPIMKLDEWIETSESDDAADDWFLRAPQTPDEPEQATEDSERPGRRRRRRRGGRSEGEGGDDQPRETATEPLADLGMNVVFRKRS